MPESKSTPERHFFKPGDRIFRVPRVTSWQILPTAIHHPGPRGISTSILIWGFAAIIVIGAFLLMLPISTESGHTAHPVNALFTATSASCVTGLAVVDTADYWSPFGEVIILILMQVGGFGFMTMATLFLVAMGRKIGLRERFLIRESMGVAKLGGVVRIVKQIAIFSIIVEILGAALIYLSISTHYTPGMAVWKSIFQSVSAFNNAGLDLFGHFQSMTGYQGNTLLILTTAGLIILGGISYMVIADIARVRRFARLSLDSKLVITTTLILLTAGTIVILLTEMNNPATLGPMPLSQKILNAFFHAVTPRTAGFATLNIGNFAVYSLFFTMFLMFIGGASGSTAGGIKVNTFGMLVATLISTIRGREKAGAFGREFTTQQIYRALTLVMLSIGLISIIVFVLTITEKFSFLQLLFETISAFGTVGLSTGITPGLSIIGKLLITLMMFIGRVGPLALVLSLAQHQQATEFNYPQETIRIG